jgi:hypothetical protein
MASMQSETWYRSGVLCGFSAQRPWTPGGWAEVCDGLPEVLGRLVDVAHFYFTDWDLSSRGKSLRHRRCGWKTARSGKWTVRHRDETGVGAGFRSALGYFGGEVHEGQSLGLPRGFLRLENVCVRSADSGGVGTMWPFFLHIAVAEGEPEAGEMTGEMLCRRLAERLGVDRARCGGLRHRVARDFTESGMIDSMWDVSVFNREFYGDLSPSFDWCKGLGV